MRSVTIDTVINHGTVLPQERSALLGVTGVAGFVDVVLDQQFWPGGSMRVMAVGANHLAFTDRMVRNTMLLSTLLFVAGKTYFRLGGLGQHLVLLGMDFMTV